MCNKNRKLLRDPVPVPRLLNHLTFRANLLRKRAGHAWRQAERRKMRHHTPQMRTHHAHANKQENRPRRELAQHLTLPANKFQFSNNRCWRYFKSMLYATVHQKRGQNIRSRIFQNILICHLYSAQRIEWTSPPYLPEPANTRQTRLKTKTRTAHPEGNRTDQELATKQAAQPETEAVPSHQIKQPPLQTLSERTEESVTQSAAEEPAEKRAKEIKYRTAQEHGAVSVAPEQVPENKTDTKPSESEGEAIGDSVSGPATALEADPDHVKTIPEVVGKIATQIATEAAAKAVGAYVPEFMAKAVTQDREVGSDIAVHAKQETPAFVLVDGAVRYPTYMKTDSVAYNDTRTVESPVAEPVAETDADPVAEAETVISNEPVRDTLDENVAKQVSESVACLDTDPETDSSKLRSAQLKPMPEPTKDTQAESPTKAAPEQTYKRAAEAAHGKRVEKRT